MSLTVNQKIKLWDRIAIALIISSLGWWIVYSLIHADVTQFCSLVDPECEFIFPPHFLVISFVMSIILGEGIFLRAHSQGDELISLKFASIGVGFISLQVINWIAQSKIAMTMFVGLPILFVGNWALIEYIYKDPKKRRRANSARR